MFLTRFGICYHEVIDSQFDKTVISTYVTGCHLVFFKYCPLYLARRHQRTPDGHFFRRKTGQAIVQSLHHIVSSRTVLPIPRVACPRPVLAIARLPIAIIFGFIFGRRVYLLRVHIILYGRLPLMVWHEDGEVRSDLDTFRSGGGI